MRRPQCGVVRHRMLANLRVRPGWSVGPGPPRIIICSCECVWQRDAHPSGDPRSNRLSVAAAAPAVRSPAGIADCSTPSTRVTSPYRIRGVRVSVFASSKLGVRGNALLVDRRCVERRSHRGGDTADHAVPDQLLVVELDVRGAESNHVDDVETPIGLHQRHRTIVVVWVHEPESSHDEAPHLVGVTSIKAPGRAPPNSYVPGRRLEFHIDCSPTRNQLEADRPPPDPAAPPGQSTSGGDLSERREPGGQFRSRR